MVTVFLALASYAGTGIVELPGPDSIEIEKDGTVALADALAAYDAHRWEDAARQFAALADASRAPELRAYEALAAFSAGNLGEADMASALAIQAMPTDPQIVCLRSVVLAELGRGDEAVALIDGALPGTPAGPVHASLLTNRAMVRLGQGKVTLARGDLDAAKAEADGDPEVLAAISSDLAIADSMQGRAGSGFGGLTAVEEKLRKGDIKGAAAAVPSTDTGDRRERAQALIAKGEVARAQGRLDSALSAYDEARSVAEGGGLIREEGLALARTGFVYSATGRPELAIEHYQRAIALVNETTFVVDEIEWRLAAGEAALYAGDDGQAKAQLDAAKLDAKGVEDVLLNDEIAELDGLMIARSGDPTRGAARIAEAVKDLEGRALWADAARVATHQVEVEAMKGDAGIGPVREHAMTLFVKAGDPCGAGHLGIAEGLGRHRRGDSTGALKAFAAAADAMDALGTTQSAQIAAIARQDAAQILIANGHDPAVIAAAGDLGLDQVVQREEAFADALAAFDEASQAFDDERYEDARRGFDAAAKGFAGIQENGPAKLAKQNRARSEFNATMGMDPAKALPVWDRLVEEGRELGLSELQIAASGAGAVDAAALGRQDALTRLESAVVMAERIGDNRMAGACYAELAHLESGLADREKAARKAYVLLDGDPQGVYALYSVAVDAFNAGDYRLALDLTEPIASDKSALGDSIRQVRSGAKEALEE